MLTGGPDFQFFTEADSAWNRMISVLGDKGCLLKNGKDINGNVSVKRIRTVDGIKKYHKGEVGTETSYNMPKMPWLNTAWNP